MLRERLQARQGEIEAAALARTRAIADPAEVADPAYAEGLRAAVAAAVAYGIETTGREGQEPPIPIALLAQARMAARAGIPLDTVLRRYFAGYSLLGYFILEEATNAGIADGDELKRLLGAHAGLFDRLLAAVGEEHAREAETLTLSTGERRRAERIERLLAGEPVDTSGIAYDFEGWHVGVAAAGPGAERVLRDLAAEHDCRVLIVPGSDGTAWAWLGSRRRPDPHELLDKLGPGRDAGGPPLALALGEPAEGLAGWRLTHRQAAAALPMSECEGGKLVCYADVALLTAIVHDDVLADSLRRLYLEPLARERDGGLVSRETLRAYIAAQANASSAAAMLAISRQAVAKRLRVVEERIGRPIGACLSELDAALRLAEFDSRRR